MAKKKKSSSAHSISGLSRPDDGLWIYDELTDEICRKILCQDGETYTDEEIKLIRGLLEEWGEVIAENLVREINNST